jgi:AraC-like DNA-binding protein
MDAPAADFNAQGQEFARLLPSPAFRAVPFGREALSPTRAVRPRHRHGAGYATVVLAGSFIEAGFAGNLGVRPGEVLLHGALDCHADRPLTRKRIEILRLPWSDPSLEGRFEVRDADAVARLAERDPQAAALALRMTLSVAPPRDVQWTHVLAGLLAGGTALPLAQLAARWGLRPTELSRGFRCAFGVSPKRFRLEARTRSAWLSVIGSPSSLTRIAQDHGFADLAHMSRSVRTFTGLAPNIWRRAEGYRTQVRSS